MVLADLGGFVLACLVLIASGSLLVRCLIGLASFLRLSQFVASFIIMAASTSLPELFVGITSALDKVPAITLGTVIGSNIADMTLVAGIAILVAKGRAVATKEIRWDSFWMFVTALVPMALMVWGNNLSRLDGAVLVSIFLIHAYFLVKRFKQKNHSLPNKQKNYMVILNTLGLVLFLPLLFYSAKYVVRFGSSLALGIGIPEITVGLFFVGLGTSLPELAFEARAMRKGYSGLAFGDLIGSVIYNSTLVLGVTALIHPITASFSQFATSAMMMVALLFLFNTFAVTTGRFNWREGISLILFYALFLMVELNLERYLFAT